MNNNLSRIGSHDSFVKRKAVLSRLRGRFWKEVKNDILQYLNSIDCKRSKIQVRLLTRQEQFVLTTIQEMKYSLVKMLVSNV